MVRSITFTGESGYISKKIPEPNCSVRGYNGENRDSRWFSDEDKKIIDKYELEKKEWEKHKDEYLNPQLVKNLIGRKINFEPGKINLIFGPNASGKTTILKAIAGCGGTTDGYPKLVGPLDLVGFHKEMSYDAIEKYYKDMMQNSADIDWDGAPIYYDNFSNRKSYGSIGDLCGSVLGNDIMTEIKYIIEKDKISLGQNSMYLMNKLFAISKEQLCYADIFSQYVNADGTFKEDFGVNDIWAEAYKIQLSYYLSREKSLVKSPSTFLFDELDKSLDIANIHALYTEVLPMLVKETGIQIIIISHSPLVLSDKIRNNELYNFISIDEQYTKNCLEHLGKLF